MKPITACKVFVSHDVKREMEEVDGIWHFQGYDQTILDADWIRQHERGEFENKEYTKKGIAMASRLDSLAEFEGWREFDLIYIWLD